MRGSGIWINEKIEKNYCNCSIDLLVITDMLVIRVSFTGQKRERKYPGNQRNGYAERTGIHRGNRTGRGWYLNRYIGGGYGERGKGSPCLDRKPQSVFFPEDKTIIKYEGEFDVAGVYFKEKDVKFGRTDVEVSVEKEKILENGILYSIKIFGKDKFYYDDGEAGQYGKKRLHLGYFYVQAEKIYLIRDMEIGSDITEKELIKHGKVVCQPEPKEDILDPEEKGRHEGIGIIGDQCIYGWYQNYIETDWWESFTWQKGLGLVEYKSGRGALAELVYITIKP